MILAEDLRDDLSGAVERGEIVPYYQPQIDVASGRIVGVEALCRWNHPTFGMIPPDDFIPVAEDSGSIHDIGEFMIDQGCELAARWQGEGRVISISVNVSAVQLSTRRFFDHLAERVRELALAPHSMVAEITESQVIADFPRVSAWLAVLRERGIGISIDDFGTGFSSIGQVLGLPATELKIDQTLIQDETATSVTVMTAVVALARDRGLRLVAEGIESERQLARIRDLHFDRAQGYLLGRPRSTSDLALLLDAT